MDGEQNVNDATPRVRPVGLLPLWFGLLGGHIAWSLQLLVGYYLVSLACAGGFAGAQVLGVGAFDLLIWLLTLVAALVALGAGVIAWKSWRRTGVGGHLETGGPAGRSGFMALAGVLLDGLFVLIILTGGIALLGLEPCG